MIQPPDKRPRFTLVINVSKDRPAALVFEELKRDGVLSMLEAMNTAKSITIRRDGTIICEDGEGEFRVYGRHTD